MSASGDDPAGRDQISSARTSLRSRTCLATRPAARTGGRDSTATGRTGADRIGAEIGAVELVLDEQLDAVEQRAVQVPGLGAGIERRSDAGGDQPGGPARHRRRRPDV
ncbi:hypothetical protein D3877_23230 [Azospirillum cavernae]|uniref:Uncharacterized protein n=1 Tax=Azospirillum cavernae TaxID=2320860 RepID=A0A418VP54_9PROT|nr:hypothetical protein D3877_23230 [Azospirillum cavernae]